MKTKLFINKLLFKIFMLTNSTPSVADTPLKSLAPPSEFPFFTQNNIKFFSKEDYNDFQIMEHFIQKSEDQEPFHIADLSMIVEQFKLWKTHLPRIEPFYAVKCNHEPLIIQTLAALGCGFDCASKGEIAHVRGLNVPADKIIYANTVKSSYSIEFAKSENVEIMTFDNDYELDKIKLHYPEAKLLLRIITDSSQSIYKLSTKFGCSVEDAKTYLKKAKSLELDVIGVSFHVGSMCNALSPYTAAIEDAREVFRFGLSIGHKMTVLDVGGGFPGVNYQDRISFEDIAKTLNEGLDKYFADVKDLRVIAEPGRHFAARSQTLLFRVIGKRKVITGKSEEYFEYHINDGVHGSFILVPYGESCPEIKPFKEKGNKTYKSIIYGPVCTESDKLSDDAQLPELDVDDWCYIPNFGSYTQGCACDYNGFSLGQTQFIFRC